MKTQELLYVLSFTVFVTWWIVAGIKNKKDLLSWIASGGIIFLLMITGSEIEILLDAVIFKFSNHYSGHLGIAGAMFSGASAFVFLNSILKWSEKISSTVTPVFFICAALMFCACLPEGCCFGTMTGFPLHITYSNGEPAHFWQSATGILSLNAENTFPLHPVQIYKVLACLICIPLYVTLKNKMKLRASISLSACFAFLYLSLFAFSFLEQRLSVDNKNYLLFACAMVFFFFAIFQLNIFEAKLFNLRKTGISLPVLFCVGATALMFFAEWIVFIPVIIVQGALVAVLITERVKQVRKSSASAKPADLTKITESEINVSF